MSTADGRNARKLKVMHVQMDNPGSEILDISDVYACMCLLAHSDRKYSYFTIFMHRKVRCGHNKATTTTQESVSLTRALNEPKHAQNMHKSIVDIPYASTYFHDCNVRASLNPLGIVLWWVQRPHLPDNTVHDHLRLVSMCETAVRWQWSTDVSEVQ